MATNKVVAGLLLISSVLAPGVQATPVAADGGTRLIANGGAAVLVSRPFGPEGGVQPPEFPPTQIDSAREGDQGSEVQLRRGAGPSTNVANNAAAQDVPSAVVTGDSAQVRTSFNGLNLRQQRLANGGNQFTVEPPDQGLCVGNGSVVETINDVLRVFDTSGTPRTGVIDLNTFLGYPAQFDRTTGLQGPFVTDPSCWFDAPTQRFYHIVLTLEVFPDTGDFTGVNHLDLSVSNTANPADGWTIYRTDVTDDGTNGTPNHECQGGPTATGHHAPTHPNACIGDFPHLGADANGIYVTTNEYCLFCQGIGFHAAQVYAFDKRALAAREPSVHVTQIDTAGMQSGKPGFTLWPATTPNADDFELASNGTEYLSSSNAAEEATGIRNSTGTNRSNQIVTWALSNTASLATATPNLHLRNAVVNVETYSPPAPSNQKAGNFPLGQCLNDTMTPTIFGTVGCWTVILASKPQVDEVEGPLDSSDSRVLSTTFSNGKLYGTLDTGLKVRGKTQAGVLFYVIRPRVRSEAVDASLVRQGQIGLAGNNVIFGTIASTHTGRTVVGFTLVGNDHYPSAGYVSLDDGGFGNNSSFNSANTTDRIKIISEGVGPQDGFSEYKAFSPTNDNIPRPRWGDYGASVATDNNTIWLGAEYIAQTCTLAQYMAAPFGSCDGTRVTLGNWATRITSLDVSAPDGGR